MKRQGLFYGAFDKKKLIGAIFVDDGIDRPKAWIFFFDVIEEYRKKGEWKKADGIRARLLKMGIKLEDTSKGVRWKRILLR